MALDDPLQSPDSTSFLVLFGINVFFTLAFLFEFVAKHVA
jgi:hypothetical protein